MAYIGTYALGLHACLVGAECRNTRVFGNPFGIGSRIVGNATCFVGCIGGMCGACSSVPFLGSFSSGGSFRRCTLCVRCPFTWHRCYGGNGCVVVLFCTLFYGIKQCGHSWCCVWSYRAGSVGSFCGRVSSSRTRCFGIGSLCGLYCGNACRTRFWVFV